MPPVSPAQKKLIERAAASDGGFGGVSQAAAKEFLGKDEIPDWMSGFLTWAIQEAAEPEHRVVGDEANGFRVLAMDKEFGPYRTREVADLIGRRVVGKASFAIAFDKDSVRSLDANGRLHLSVVAISKAAVNPYYGGEIPDYEALGLDPDKVYMMFRAPEELEKAAGTFNNIQLLDEHIPVDASNPQSTNVAGTTGSDAAFDGTYLTNSMAVWVKESIDLIESDDKKELSSSYGYTPDMTPGTWNGQKYDGVMRNLVGNHVALVVEGRAGPDVVVGDSALQPKETDMAKPVVLTSRAAMALHGALMAHVLPKLAKDKKIDLTPLFKDVNRKTLLAADGKVDKKALSKIWKGAKDLAEPMMAPEAKAAGGMGPDDVIHMLASELIGKGSAEGVEPAPDEMVAAPAAEADGGLAAFLKTLGLDDEAIAKAVEMAGKKPAAAAPAAEGEDDEPEVEMDAMPENGITKKTLDAEIEKVTKAADKKLQLAVDAVKKNATDLADTREFVRPWVSNLSLAHDSPVAVLHATLANLGFDSADYKDVQDPKALRLIIATKPKLGEKAPAANDSVILATDAAVSTDLSKRYPGAAAIVVN